MSSDYQSFMRLDLSALRRVFYMTAPAPCPYLDGRTERKLITAMDFGDDEDFHMLSKAGFRRSHEIAYRPACPSCDACKSVRIPAKAFEPNRTQRKILNRNADLVRSLHINEVTQEHWDLFETYIKSRHGDSEMAEMTPDDLRVMIEQSTVETGLIEWRDGEGHLRACMLFDQLADGISAVYTFFDPEETRRSLGTFAIIDAVDHVAMEGLEHLYLGFWIKGSATMAYKGSFKGIEVHGFGAWSPIEIEPTSA